MGAPDITSRYPVLIQAYGGRIWFKIKMYLHENLRCIKFSDVLVTFFVTERLF